MAPSGGTQMEQLQKAILSAFNGSDLEMLVRFELNERLDAVVAPGPLADVVFQLIGWAEKHGRTADLVRAVRQARPNNPEIRALADALLPAPAAPAPAGTGRLDGHRRARLRAALLDQFPTRAAVAMLASDALDVNLNTVSGDSNLTATVFELIVWTAIDPQGRLRPLLAEAVKQRPSSAELAALDRELFGV